MPLILIVLLFSRAAAATNFDPAACEKFKQRGREDCESNGCQGIIVTGGSPPGAIPPAECQNLCKRDIDIVSQGDRICGGTIVNAESSPGPTTSQADAQKNAGEQAEKNESVLKEKEVETKEANRFSEDLQARTSKSNDQLIAEWNKELASGKSQAFPSERSKWENDRTLVNESKRAQAKKEPFPRQKAGKAQLPAIRSNLYLFSRGRQLEEKSSKNLAAIALALAQLAQMKSAAKAKVEGLAAQGSQNSYPSSAYSPKEEKQAAQAQSSLEGSQKSSGLHAEGEKAGIADEKAEASQAGGTSTEARRSSLRARLKELIAKRMGANGGEEISDQFLGELGLSPDFLLGEKGAEEPHSLSKEDEEIFRLAGAETDAEVRRLQAALQEELARTEGVLPSESMSLFERVKAAHDACAAKKCVLLEEVVALRR